jgi:hypothetical protein
MIYGIVENGIDLIPTGACGPALVEAHFSPDTLNGRRTPPPDGGNDREQFEVIQKMGTAIALWMHQPEKQIAGRHRVGNAVVDDGAAVVHPIGRSHVPVRLQRPTTR